MSTIRPALITRLYKAIDQHRLSDAVLLLSQLYDGNHLDERKRADYFLECLRLDGERLEDEGKLAEAEEYFALAIALYDRFFPTLHYEGIASARHFSEVLLVQKKEAELARSLDYAYQIVQRLSLAKAGEPLALATAGTLANSLVRRHQISHYVDTVANKRAGGGSNGSMLNVLLVEDNSDDAGLVQEALASTEMLPIATMWAQYLTQGLEHMQREDVDVIVLDLTLPDATSLQSLDKIRESNPGVPIVILTGDDNNDLASRAIQKGAHDFLIKGKTNGATVLRSVLRAVEDSFKPKVQEMPTASVTAFIDQSPFPMLHLSNDLHVFAMNASFAQQIGADWSGMSLAEAWPDLSIERILEATEQGGGVELRAVPLPAKSARRAYVDLTIWPVQNQDKLTDGLMVVITEISSFASEAQQNPSKAQAYNMQLREELAEGRRERSELRSRITQQSALTAVSQLAVTGSDIAHTLSEAVKLVSGSLGATTVLVMGTAEDGDIKVISSFGLEASQYAGLTAHIESEPIYRLAFNSDSPVVIKDFSEQVFARSPQSLKDLGIASGAFCRIKGRQEKDSLLAVLFEEPHDLTSDDALFLRAMTNILATVVERNLVDKQVNELAEELKRSNADLQQFAYAAAHDLQEPLRSIVSYLELLSQRLDGKLDEKSTRYMSVATAAGKRMQQLISDLLEYSRVSSRAQPLTKTNIKDLVEFVRDNLQKSFDDNNATMSVGPMPSVEVDQSQLIMVFQNLIGNAIKFRQENVPPHIEVQAVEQEDYWHFSVKDNGIGFNIEYAERIFVIFQRLHTRQKYSGTGIGLALCKKIIERHGGRIWVESTPDVGTTFHFTLPKRG